jgi:multidrug efflux pump subunit AcrA (membrane-fusion protein)
VGIARKWIFPILRIIIFLAIAGALVKMAFFSGAIAPTDPTVPTAQIEEPIATVEIGTITNDVTLPATVQADAAVPVRATLAGEVKKVLIGQGQAVGAATPMLTIRSEVPSADGASVAIKTVTVTAGSAGVLSSFPVIVGQVVAVGDVIGQVAPPTFSVSGSLSPEQQYRLLNRPTEAQVAITGGPAPFTCTGLTITSALAGAASDASSTSDAGSGSSTSGTTIRCAVPAGVTVFSGLAAKLTISGGVAKDVLVIPITAVEGSAQTGVVYTQKAGGAAEKHPVTIGLTDGTNVEITGGLAKGDLILQYVPGAIATPDCEDPRFVGSPECQGVGG